MVGGDIKTPFEAIENAKNAVGARTPREGFAKIPALLDERVFGVQIGLFIMFEWLGLQ